MGMIKDAKANSLRIDAEKAVAAGQTVYTPRLNMPGSQVGLSAGITDWALMIEAIEAAGWRLEHWAIGMDTKGRGEAYPLFRRSAAAPPPPPA